VLESLNEELIVNVKIAHSTDGEKQKFNVDYVDGEPEILVDKTLFYKDRAHISD